MQNRSESIKELAAAFAKAQPKIEGATKDKSNPAFRSKYADLANVVDAIKPALGENGLSFLQIPQDVENAAKVETILLHSSGEYLSLGTVTVPVTKHDAHGFGSALTYARRYGLLTAFGVAPEDDDGNAASQAATNRPQAVAKAPDGFDDWLADLELVAADGSEALKSAWTKSQPYMRQHLTSTDNAKWEALKAKAAKVKAV